MLDRFLDKYIIHSLASTKQAQIKRGNKMNFQYFKELFAIGARIARDMAQANGVSMAQVQIWENTLRGAK